MKMLSLNRETLRDLTLVSAVKSPLYTKVNSCGVCQPTRPTRG